MTEIALNQTAVVAGSPTKVYLPVVFSGGQQYTYSFIVPAPAPTALPDNLATKDLLTSYVANNFQLPTSAVACVSLWYDYSTVNMTALIGSVSDFQMVRLLTQNTKGVYVTDKTHGIMEIPSNGTTRQVCMKFAQTLNTKGFVQVQFPQTLSSLSGFLASFSVGGQISSDGQVCIANLVLGDAAHPLTTSSAWVYVSVIGGGALPGNAQLYCDIVGVP